MRGRYFLTFLVFLVFSASANAGVFLGVVDGYVTDMSNAAVQGANITITISGCSGGAENGCSGSQLSDLNGYYVVANLNLNAYGTLTAAATASAGGYNASGSAAATANQFLVASANITICFPLSYPLLIDQGDSHDNSVTLYWNSGTDPFGYSTYDEFQLDSGPLSTEISPVSLNTTYSIHIWKVRTCKTNGVAGCCSPFSSDSFSIYNNPPLPPTLSHQGNTHSQSASLFWTNGSDTDGDNIYHQFQIDSQAVQNNSFSPVAVSGLSFGAHTWRVRACDFMSCSSWAEDTFTISNNPPSSPILRIQGNTTNTTVSLNWTSGIDPESDPVHDEFQFSIYYDFSTNILSLSNATHPVSIPALSSFEKYYWRARSCDSQSCSPWASSSFVKYVCTSSNGTTNCTSNCSCNCKCPSCSCGGGTVTVPVSSQKIINTILPVPSVQVSVAATGAFNVTYPEIVPGLKLVSESPIKMSASWAEMLKSSWWKILILLAIIILVLILMKKRKDEEEEGRERRNFIEYLKTEGSGSGHNGEPFEQ